MRGRDAQERRHIRGKSAVRKMDPPVANPEEVQEELEKVGRMRVQKVVEEEMQGLINDDPELAAEKVKLLGRL